MIKNSCGYTEFLRDLKTGEPAVWFCKEEFAQPAMKTFTATVTKGKFNFKITQKKAMLVVEGRQDSGCRIPGRARPARHLPEASRVDRACYQGRSPRIAGRAGCSARGVPQCTSQSAGPRVGL